MDVATEFGNIPREFTVYALTLVQHQGDSLDSAAEEQSDPNDSQYLAELTKV